MCHDIDEGYTRGISFSPQMKREIVGNCRHLVRAICASQNTSGVEKNREVFFSKQGDGRVFVGN